MSLEIMSPPRRATWEFSQGGRLFEQVASGKADDNMERTMATDEKSDRRRRSNGWHRISLCGGGDGDSLHS